jgi:eukaryotic-like serine/threonine-protein kinase
VASVCSGDVVADKYRVERMLGTGGMGYVVAARHLTLDQLVAIKFLSKGSLGDEEAYARFRREAKACVRLKGDHVARVFDVGVHDGDEPFIVMEYLDGADLSSVTKERGPLSIGEAAEYILQACEALAEAHSLGIVHRDVKLANIFLTHSPSGWPLVKVLDFGVSKTIAASELASDVTRTAAMLGSPKYMSPEQMNDPRGVDARTDVWSLGVCLYRLIAGRPPFDGETIGRLCTMVLHETAAPLSHWRADVPTALDNIVAACLQKDRSGRFANVAELAAALVPFCIEQERAREMAAHVASVLGVPAPPPGYIPQHIVVQQMQASGGSLEGAAAWARTYAAQKQKQAEDRRTWLGYMVPMVGAACIGLTLIGVVLANRSTTSPPPTLAAPVPVPMPAPPPSVTTDPAQPTPTEEPKPVASVAPTATVTATEPRPSPPPTAKKVFVPARAGTTSKPGDGLSIPGDRK